jgi:hypothetical protein
MPETSTPVSVAPVSVAPVSVAPVSVAPATPVPITLAVPAAPAKFRMTLLNSNPRPGVSDPTARTLTFMK